MRMAGRLPDEDQARRLVNYLCVQGIKSQYDQDAAEWLIWVEDEQRVAESKQILQDFQNNPAQEKFVITEQEVKKHQATARKKANYVKMSERWDRRVTGGTPVITAVLITLSVVVAMLTNFGVDPERRPYVLMISETDFVLFPANYWNLVGTRITNGLSEVRTGEVWRLVTPIFIHVDPLHLVFNMMSMFYLAVYVEGRMGFWKYLGFVLGAAIIPNLLQYYFGGPSFGGMSGVGYAVFGYLWLGSKWNVDIPPLDEITMILGIIWLVLGFTGLLGVANGAHAGGFLFGVSWVVVAYYTRKYAQR